MKLMKYAIAVSLLAFATSSQAWWGGNNGWNPFNNYNNGPYGYGPYNSGGPWGYGRQGGYGGYPGYGYAPYGYGAPQGYAAPQRYPAPNFNNNSAQFQQQMTDQMNAQMEATRGVPETGQRI